MKIIKYNYYILIFNKNRHNLKQKTITSTLFPEQNHTSPKNYEISPDIADPSGNNTR